MKKKAAFLLTTMALMTFLLAGCAQTNESPSESNEPSQSSGQAQVPENEDVNSNDTQNPDTTAPVVYMTTDISPEASGLSFICYLPCCLHSSQACW